MYARKELTEDALTLLTAELGHGKRRGNKWWWNCPFHPGDNDPSFALYPDGHMYCYGCHTYLHDINAFYKQRYHIDTAYQPEPMAEHKAPEWPDLCPNDAKIPHEFGRSKALPYFQQRAISEPVFDRTLLGYTDKWSPKTDDHWVKLGDAWEKIPTRFYTIPYMANDKVLAIQRRRDDGHVREYMEEVPELVKTVQHHYPDEDVVNKMFGPRYNMDWRSKFRALPYGIDLFVEYNEMGKHYRAYDFALITEGEIDQLALRTAGFPALKAKKSSDRNIVKGVPILLQNVEHIFIIADNDANGAGLLHALAIREIVGKGYILMPPKGFKDVDDLAVAGELYTWLKKHSLEPILKENEQ